jgi:hypothetical protein
VVADAGKVFYAASADEDDAVFLEVMAFTADIGDDLLAVRKADPCDLSEGRVRLLRGLGFDLDADAPFLSTLLQSG